MTRSPASQPDRAAADAPIVGRLVSLNVGRPREVPFNGHTVTTAIWKDPVAGRRAVRRMNIDGDEQADLAAHGGEHRAVFVYQVDSYRYWARELARDDLTWGHFGENFTVEGLPDDEVCIGDRYRIGSAVFEVTQPRVTCFRVGLRLEDARMPALLVAHHRPGFYLRVIGEGEVGAGDPIERLSTGPERLTVAEADALLYLPHRSAHTLQRALRIDALSEGWKRSFRALREQGSPAPAAPAWPGFVPTRVTAIERESATIVSITLAPTGAQAEAVDRAVAPGQYLTLRLHPGGGEGPEVIRSYSLSRPPDRGALRISVKREPGGTASGYLHERLRAGDVIEAAAPRGDFLLRDGTRPVVLISAGVGATPVLAMLHRLAATGDPRPVWWLHAARNAAEHPFAPEVDALLARLPDAHRMVVYSRPATGDSSDAVGHLTAETIADAGAPVDADYYVCGPEAFMHSLSAGLAARGTPPERIAVELFGAGAVIAPPGMQGERPAPHAPAGRAGTGPEVTFARSGLSVPWDAELGTLLDLAEACDVPVSFGCRNGVCHYCETGVLTGSVDYVTLPLEQPAGDRVLMCCAVPVGPVTLEL